jgi:anti-sigma B factor antagonist
MSEKQIVSIETRDEAVLAVVQSDRLDWDNSPGMKQEVSAAAMKAGDVPIILVMTRVEFVESMWLSVLVELMQESKQRCQPFSLAEIQPQVRDLLALTRLDKLFEIHATVDEAIARAGAGPRTDAGSP